MLLNIKTLKVLFDFYVLIFRKKRIQNMIDPIFTPSEKRLFHRLNTQNYHLIEDLLVNERVNVNARGGNLTPMQFLMDSLTPYPQKLKNQSKKSFRKKAAAIEYDLHNEVWIFELLAAHGLDLSVKDRNNDSYLITAAQKGRVDMMQAFVKAGMMFNKADIKSARAAAKAKNYVQAEKYLVAMESALKKIKKGAKVPKALQSLLAVGTAFDLNTKGALHAVTASRPKAFKHLGRQPQTERV